MAGVDEGTVITRFDFLNVKFANDYPMLSKWIEMFKNNHIPFELRQSLASWIEAQNW